MHKYASNYILRNRVSSVVTSVDTIQHDASVDAGVDTDQRWIFLKNIIISLMLYLHIVNNIFKLISYFVFTL